MFNFKLGIFWPISLSYLTLRTHKLRRTNPRIIQDQSGIKILLQQSLESTKTRSTTFETGIAGTGCCSTPRVFHSFELEQSTWVQFIQNRSMCKPVSIDRTITKFLDTHVSYSIPYTPADKAARTWEEPWTYLITYPDFPAKKKVECEGVFQEVCHNHNKVKVKHKDHV